MLRLVRFFIVIILLFLSISIKDICIGDKLFLFLGLPPYVNGFHIPVIGSIIIILLIYLATSFWEVYNSSDGNRKSKYIILCLKWLLLFVVCGVFIILNAAC